MPKTPNIKPNKVKQGKLSKEKWVASARRILVREGIQNISLRKLSKSLSATTGAFYWQFKSLEELLDELREDWIRHNTSVFSEIFENSDLNGKQKWLAYAREIIVDHNFDPQYDNAMRDWANSSKKTARLVQKIDALRVGQLTRMFVQMGYAADLSLIRARVTYLHQCGYYAMGIAETTEERLAKAPLYAEVLTGKNMYSSSDDIEIIRNEILKG